MSDIFLSYASEDRERAKTLADALQTQGWCVFWDRTIKPGQKWHEVIDGALRVSRCVVVAWSEAALQSDWVRDEAEEGKSRNILVPVLFDQVKPPLGFRAIQAGSLVGWSGDASAQSFQQLVAAVSGLLGSAPAAAPQAFETASRVQASPDAETAAGARRDSSLAPLSRFHDRLQDGSEGPEMVVIPAGEFRMGDLNGKGYSYERPVRTVRFAKPFALGRYAVTFDEYDAFARAAGKPLPDDEDWGRGRRPVINVSWHDAAAYAQWLSEQTGGAYRLPSEAEWEYAARAGTTTAYWWGEGIGVNRANCDGSGSRWADKLTAPVGSFEPNPWGLYDTAGNVWEWVQDLWQGDYRGAPTDGSAWEADGAASGARVLRGGSWFDTPSGVRAAYRDRIDPALRYNGIGFRLARTLS